jgi:hypothetical protein
MTEKQKKIGIINGLELFQPNGDNKKFLDYLGKLTQEAQDYIVPIFGKLNMIKQNKTLSGKYKIYLNEHQEYTKEQINALINDISNDKKLLP